MANERYLEITVAYDPDLTKHIKRSGKKHTDAVTGETIKKGSSCWKLGYRYDTKLYSIYICETTYEKINTIAKDFPLGPNKKA